MHVLLVSIPVAQLLEAPRNLQGPDHCNAQARHLSCPRGACAQIEAFKHSTATPLKLIPESHAVSCHGLRRRWVAEPCGLEPVEEACLLFMALMRRTLPAVLISCRCSEVSGPFPHQRPPWSRR